MTGRSDELIQFKDQNHTQFHAISRIETIFKDACVNSDSELCMSHLDDVVRGVFVIWGHIQADQDALTVQVPYTRQCLHEAPLTRRPLILPTKPVPHDWPPKLWLFQGFQHWLGIQLLQYSYGSTHGEIEKNDFYGDAVLTLQLELG